MRATALQGLSERETRTLTEPLRILVVDDDEDGRELIAEVLRGDGAEVTEVGNGATALQAIAVAKMADPTRYFDLVITDVHMPACDGLELLALLRLGGYQVPVVLLSGLADEAIRKRARRLGATAILAKPIDPGVLRAIVVSATARPWWGGRLQHE